MTDILLLSDSHSHIDQRILYYAEKADEVWHAGDIGSNQVTDALRKVSKIKAVYGNIDGNEIRKEFPLDLHFTCEKIQVYLTHIGGYPKSYNSRTKPIIQKTRPKLFICGHSHILKVIQDDSLNLLHMNPGACGNHGFHKVRTMIQFQIDESEIKNLEVIELGKRG